MIFSEFAYSNAMQAVQFFLACGAALIDFGFVTELILSVYGVSASLKCKCAFITIVSLAGYQLFVYAVYIFYGYELLTPLLRSLLAIPNPGVALICYVCGVKFLGLSKYHSIHLMRKVYLYNIVLIVLRHIIAGVFFTQVPGRHNYMLDSLAIVTGIAVYTASFLIIKWVLRNAQFRFRLKDNLPVKNVSHDLFLSFLHAAAIYALAVIMPLLTPSLVPAYLGTFFILALLLLLSILLHYNRTVKNELENKDINALIMTSAIDDFSGLKHDFYNILQTYEGYITLGDLDKLEKYHKKLLGTTRFVNEQLDLAPQMTQNPVFTSLLVDKMRTAEEAGVMLSINILCNIKQLHISNEDLCQVVSILLDTAIDAAAGSQHRHVSLTAEKKDAESTLIIINSIADIVPEAGPAPPEENWLQSSSFVQIHKIIYRYRNVFFHAYYEANGFSAYIELTPAK